MTFKGDTIIGKPTLEMVEIYVGEKGYHIEPKETYDYWENKNWCNKKGLEISNLEGAIDIYNENVINKILKRNAREFGITKLSKRQKNIEKRRLRKALISGGEIWERIENEKVVSKPKPKKVKEKFSYAEQLKDKKWLAFRKFIFAVRGKACEMCGSTKILQVHHPKYKYGRKAWEYTCNDVIVLCQKCHEKVHNIKNDAI